MSERPAYFVVQRLYGREVPSIIFDYLPRTPLRSLVYILRLDQLPNSEAFAKASLNQLFALYQSLKAKGKLPPRWEPPKKGKAEATDA